MEKNQLDPNKLKKLEEMVENKENPYQYSYETTHNYFEELNDGIEETIRIAGRVTAKRKFGKLTFAEISNGNQKIQIALEKNRIGKLNSV